MQALDHFSSRHRRITKRDRSPESLQRRVFGRQGVLRHAFTLIEVLVVVVIIAVLATLVAPSVFQHVGEAKATTARTQIAMLGAALDGFRLNVGRYPTTAEGLAALWERPAAMTAGWRGPYLRRAAPMDPWGHPYVYASPGEHDSGGYDLSSLGGDGRAGGDGEASDVRSW